jgi:SH3 domain-containing protein
VRAPAAVVRAAPSHSVPRLGSLSRGDVVPELDREEGWLRVRLRDGRAGWVRADLLGDVPSAP